jgi:hypothetical protein
MSKVPWHWLVGAAILAVVAASGTLSADQGATPEDLLADLSLRVTASLESACHNRERGVDDAAEIRRRAETAEHALESIEQRLLRSPEGSTPAAEAKLAVARLLVADLRRAADSTIPPCRFRPQIEREFRIGGHRRAGLAEPNDDCNDATPVSLGTYSGDTRDASNDGQAQCGSSLYSPDVWFQFSPVATGYYVVDTIGSTFDTVLSVHSSCPGTMSNELTCNDDAHGLQSITRFHGTEGEDYLIRVSGVHDATGEYQLTISRGGAISGTVTSSQGGQPISTQVTVYDADGYTAGFAGTDAAGNYEISGLIPGLYTLLTSGTTGWVDELYDDHPCPGGPVYDCDLDDGDAVAVPWGTTTSGIDFVLETEGIITGTVTDGSTGDPVAYERVRLFDHNGWYVDSDYTDAFGVYSFTVLDAEEHFLIAHSDLHQDQLYDGIPCPGGYLYGCNPEDGTPVSADLGQTTTANFSLVSLASISGRVTDRVTGLPIYWCDVRLYSDTGGHMVSVATDEQGEYTAAGLEGGTYYVVASRHPTHSPQRFDGLDCLAGDCDPLDGDPVIVEDSTSVTGVDFDLIRTGSIVGRVTQAGTDEPLEGVRIRISNGSGVAIGSTHTDSTGSYRVDHLDGGTYFAATDTDAYLNQLFDGIPCTQDCDPVDGTPIVVENAKETRGIDFHLVPKASISGSVSTAVGDTPISETTTLYDVNGNYVASEWSYDGFYEFHGLEDGKYFVIAGGGLNYSRYLAKLYDDVPCWGGYPSGCDLQDGTPVTATQGHPTVGIDFRLDARAQIAGVAVDSVTGYPVWGSAHLISATTGAVDSDYLIAGNFSFRALRPDDYYVVIDANDHLDQVWRGVPCEGEYPAGCSLAGGHLLSVSPNSYSLIDFELDPLGQLQGTIRSAAENLPLGGVDVTVYDESGNSVASRNSSADGEVLFLGIWPGRYYAIAERDGEYSAQLFQGLDCFGGAGVGCDPTDGTPVDLALGATAEVVFALSPTLSISGRVLNAHTGTPMLGVRVYAWGPDGTYRGFASSNSLGAYEIDGLDPETHFVSTGNWGWPHDPYIDTLYAGIPCPTGPPDGCDPTKGTPVVLTPGSDLRFIDIEVFRNGSGISGTVTDATSGQPADGVQIDVWDTDGGAWTAGAITSPAGTYHVPLDAGSFVVATDNGASWGEPDVGRNPLPGRLGVRRHLRSDGRQRGHR